MSLIFDLFIAGSETTSTLLNWTVLYLAKYPDIQAKMRQELDEVVGRSRMPTVADRDNTPYTEAVLQVVEQVSLQLVLQKVFVREWH